MRLWKFIALQISHRPGVKPSTDLDHIFRLVALTVGLAKITRILAFGDKDEALELATVATFVATLVASWAEMAVGRALHHKGPSEKSRVCCSVSMTRTSTGSRPPVRARAVRVSATR